MKTLSEIYLSENERKALLCVKSEIEKHIPKSEIILYGMQQKKDIIDVIEFDILVLLEDDICDEVKTSVRRSKITLEMKFDAVFSVMLAKRSTWKKELVRSLPGHWNINDEGVII